MGHRVRLSVERGCGHLTFNLATQKRKRQSLMNTAASRVAGVKLPRHLGEKVDDERYDEENGARKKPKLATPDFLKRQGRLLMTDNDGEESPHAFSVARESPCALLDETCVLLHDSFRPHSLAKKRRPSAFNVRHARVDISRHGRERRC